MIILILLQVSSERLLDDIYRFGALPILIILVAVLWKKVSAQEASIQKLNEEHKVDIRSNADEVKALQQNTIHEISTLNTQLPAFTKTLEKIAEKMTVIVNKIT